jgi:hypothetical protein
MAHGIVVLIRRDRSVRGYRGSFRQFALPHRKLAMTRCPVVVQLILMF